MAAAPYGSGNAGVGANKRSTGPADLVMLDFTREKIKKNFRDILTEHEIIKVLNKKGIKKFSTLTFPFSASNQKLKVYYIKIIQPDGSTIRLNTSGLKIVTAPFNPEAPIFSNQMLKTIELPGLTNGSVINYKYRVITLKPYMKNNFFAEDYFGGMSPLKKSIYSLSIPEGLYYKYAQYRLNGKPVIKKAGGYTTITWTVWNRKKTTKERMGPGESVIIPHVMVTSVKSWNDVADWYSKLTKDQIKPGKELDNFIKNLVGSKKTRFAKIKAIYNFVAKQIRYVGYEFGIEGYQPSNVNEIFKNRFGDCKDHATLFSSMLRKIGVKSYPVLVPTTEIPNMDMDIPTPFVFDHEITGIKLKNGKIMYADTTSNVTTFGDLPSMDQGRNVLIIENDKGVTDTTPVFPPEKNKVILDENAVIGKNGNLTASEVLTYTGVYEMYHRYLFSFTSEREKREAIFKKVHEIAPNAVIKSFSFKNGNSLSKPFIENIKFTSYKYAAKKGNILLIRIPIRVRTALTKIAAFKKRKYSLRFGYNFLEKTIVRLTVPKNMETVFIPRPLKIKNSIGTFSEKYSVKGNVITLTAMFKVTGYKIPAALYPKAKRLFDATIKNMFSQAIVIKLI